MSPPSRLDPRAVLWGLNTSNSAKAGDYRALMGPLGLRLGAVSQEDLPEVDGSPLQVLLHKASHFADDHILVDDACFDVQGADIGVNARWLVDQLPQLAGHRAVMRILVGYREHGRIWVAGAAVAGAVVAARGTPPQGFPLLPFFLPDGRTLTLAQARDDEVNPRALALRQLLAGQFVHVGPPPPPWQGAWQGHGPA